MSEPKVPSRRQPSSRPAKTVAAGKTASPRPSSPRAKTRTENGAKAGPPKAADPIRRAPRRKGKYRWDVCLSFAGEDRVFVERVARCLKTRGVTYFYDNDQQADLWGKNLYTHLAELYENEARFCVVFVSKHYKEKLWTNHERQAIQARAFTSKTEYLLPARFDDTDIPGVWKTTADIDLRKTTAARLADLIVEKLAAGKGSPAPGRPTTVPVAKKSAPGAAVEKSAAPPKAAASARLPRGRVSGSGDWVMIGDGFYRSPSVEEGPDDTVILSVTPADAREEAHLMDLGPSGRWQRKRAAYAHGNDGAASEVQEVKPRTEKGKRILTLVLKLDRSGHALAEMGYGDMAVDEIAAKRARLLLLGEKPSTGDRHRDDFIVGAFGREEPLQAGVIAGLWRRHKEQPTAFLQKARLAAIYHMKASGIVERVLDLTLGPASGGTLAVRFEGRRRKEYDNRPASTITITDRCPLG